MTNFELLGLFYELGDGIGFSALARWACFGTRASALTFGRASGWGVGYRAEP